MFDTLMEASVASAIFSGIFVIFQIAIVLCSKKKITVKRSFRIGLNSLYSFYFAACINVILLCVFSWWGEYNDQKDRLVLYDEVDDVPGHLLDNNYEILRKLTESNYMAMEIKEQRDVLYQLAQLESIWLLGKKTPDLRFEFKKIEADLVGGYYDNATVTIVADVDCADRYEYMIRLVTHEMWHMYEYALLDGAEQINEKVSEQNIQDYRKELELSSYISIEVDRERYVEQTCETDAYAYEERAGNMYINYIKRNFT